MSRVVRVKKVVSGLSWAYRGMTAGSGFATTEMRVVMINLVEKALLAHPSVSPTVFVDDLAADSAGPDEWIKAECARIDSTWDVFATAEEREGAAFALREQHRVDGEARRKRKLAELSEKWKEAVDKATGRKYWYNSETLETSWTDPLGDYR
jgi:hypothetical protein